MEFDWAFIGETLPILLQGAKVTFFIAAIGIPLGFILGVFLGAMRAYKVKIINPLLIIYIDLFRILPVLF